MKQQSSVSFWSLLQLTFIILKLTGTIDWSWWWVLTPIWIEIILCLLMCLLMLFVKRRK